MRNPLHALCPYFAMFPETFVAKYIELFTKPNDYVFDPFCGRGTTVLQSLLMGRNAAGSDINPVAYCVTSAKARVPNLSAVLKRISRLEEHYRENNKQKGYPAKRSLPDFFHLAFHPETLTALVFLRDELDWYRDQVDGFIAALILGSLHGEMDKSSSYFSNQMPRTISTKPKYSIRYWKRHKLKPPKRRIFDLLRQRAELRLNCELPQRKGLVSLSDVRDAGDVFRSLGGRVRAIITSPPYLNVTCYEEDQWLRLWFLGHEPKPTYRAVSSDDRHADHENYWQFLADAWEGIAPLVGRGSMFVCRLAGKDVPRKELTENLYETILGAFPRAYLVGPPIISKIKHRQTNNFRPGSKGCFFEMDYVFCLG